MSKKKDFYEILNVSKDADISEIKKNYKKLALKYHPDKNPNDEEAEEKIREITEAYSVLSDDEKRKQYDKFGTVDDDGNGGMGGVDISEIFRQMGINIPGMGEHKQEHNQEEQIPITIKEIYQGCEKNIKIDVEDKCDDCDAYGTKDKTNCDCKTCNGTGMEVKMIRPNPMIPMMQQVRQRCDKCHGEGRQIKQNNKCNKCHGEGTVTKIVNKKIEIKKNFDYETKMRLKNVGNYNKINRKNCDIIISYELIFPQNTEFTLVNGQGYDLLLEKNINIKDAFIGYTMHFKHLNGRDYHIVFDEVIEDGDVKIIMNKGLPNSPDADERSKLLVKFNINYPKKLLSKEEYNKFINKTDTYKLDNSKKLVSIDFKVYKERMEIERMERERMRQQQESHGHEQQVQCPVS